MKSESSVGADRPTSKAFHLGDILSITHDRLVSPRHMEGVYEICNFLTQDNLFTHQLPRVHDECKAHLLTLHPQLNRLPMVDDATAKFRRELDGPEWWRRWLDVAVAEFGEMLEITPIPKGIHQYRNALDELVEMVGPRITDRRIH